MIRILSLLIACFFVVGCSALNVQRPTAAVTGMAVEGVNASGFTMNFGVDVKNPNSIALPLTAADYQIGLGGVNVTQGKVKPDGSIPAGGSRSIAVPVALTYENLLAAEQSIVKSGGNVPYNFDGGLSVSTGSSLFGDVRVPLQYNGTLALKEILNNPKALMQNPAAQKLARELIGSLFSR